MPAAPADDHELLIDLAASFDIAPHRLRSPTVYRWSRRITIPGCDVGFAPGQLTAWGPLLRRPHGRVHFAGSERSTWPNNMEGAIESGERAAAEILAATRASMR